MPILSMQAAHLGVAITGRPGADTGSALEQPTPILHPLPTLFSTGFRASQPRRKPSWADQARLVGSSSNQTKRP